MDDRRLPVAAASEVSGQIGRVVPQATEIDELFDAGTFGFACSGLRRLQIFGLEVWTPERMHEVIHDLRAFEQARHRSAIGCIRGLPGDSARLITLGPRHGHDFVLAYELGKERAPDCSRGAEDDHVHSRASSINRAKYRRLTATWIRLCSRV